MRIVDLGPDLLVCTHVHADHFDEPVVQHCQTHSGARFCGPPSVCRRFSEMGISNERIISARHGHRIDAGPFGVAVVPAFHTSEDAIGLVIECEQIKVFLSGDTEYREEVIEGVRSVAPDGVELALVCVNGKYGNMDHVDAARVATAVYAQVAVPMHFGFFAENTSDPMLFCREIAGSKVTCRFMQPTRRYQIDELVATPSGAGETHG